MGISEWGWIVDIDTVGCWAEELKARGRVVERSDQVEALACEGDREGIIDIPIATAQSILQSDVIWATPRVNFLDLRVVAMGSALISSRDFNCTNLRLPLDTMEKKNTVTPPMQKQQTFNSKNCKNGQKVKKDRYTCWKVLRDAKMEPPIQTLYFLSGGATTLIFMLLGANAVISLFILSAIPGNIVEPPLKTMFP
ncbi:hypothetical protein IEQ34_017108 [Dendrobium chrysotoxum]|uniref:Uncharacterized protein n=1 Tax=Dendrobium chrysotoxum TaxID=161865 RepID=A0AAV7GAC1_DENCH|nr:hypothetical protein IEQ34_017108 [Dendrobium chrysotoxum]